MTFEEQKMRLDQIRGSDGRPSVESTDTALSRMSAVERWNLLKDGFQRGAKLVSQGRRVLLAQIDRTTTGEPHVVLSLFEPHTNQVVIEAPKFPDNSAHYPTVLHAVEVAATFVQLANPDANGADLRNLLYPSMHFVPVADFALTYRLDQVDEIIPIPLTVNPDGIHGVILNRQDRRVYPKPLAQSYYAAMQGGDLRQTLMRHTLLLHSRNGYDNPAKREAFVETSLEGRRHEFALMHLERVQPWDITPPIERYLTQVNRGHRSN